jgi:starch-binding outer membrane protein, SusD/RagB family
MKMKLFYILPVFLLAIAGCKKDYLETTPSTGVTREQIYSKLSSVNAALDGIYKETFTFNVGGGSHADYGQKAVDLMVDLMGNDMVVHSQGYGWYNTTYQYTHWGVSTAAAASEYTWIRYYDQIKQANIILDVIDGLADPAATPAEKERIKGQVLALRAYCYFYLVNYYQQSYKGNENKPGVPLVLEETLEGIGRGTVQQVYDQLIIDLTAAETLLTGKARATKQNIDVTTVQGFRARVALMMEDWATAATYANKARTGYSLMSAATYVTPPAFSTVGNSELIWGAIIPAAEATIYASFYSHMDIRTGGYAALGQQKKITKALYDLIPAGDVRKAVFNAPGSGTTTNPEYNQLKLQVPTAGSWAADYSYMRISEMYLIEAEALAEQGQDGPARTALETLVKARYPAYSAATYSGAALLNEIYLQRRIELWGEGWALLDIKRLKQGLNRPSGPGNHGGANYNPAVYTTSPEDPRFLMRIPQREIDNNDKIGPEDQNP